MPAPESSTPYRYGATAADDLGRALVVGDFNGDGVADLVMSAPAANGQAGRLYVMFGGKWPRVTDFATSDPDVVLGGADAGDYAGFTLAAVDLDGDGKSDLIVGSMLADGPQNSRPDSGEVYVMKGTTLIAGGNINLEQTGNIVYGARAGDRLGEGLTTGDVNGDGKPDLVLVATFSGGPDGTRAGAGETYVLTSPATLPLDLASSGAALEVLGADPGDQLGHSIGAGDTDGDGAADLWLGVVSADGPGNTMDLAGEAVLVAGKRSNGTLVDETAGGTNAIIYGPEATSRLGRSLAVGDLNGDGHADLAISAPNLDNRAGRVFIFFAGNSYPSDATGANIVLRGLDAGDILGYETFGTPSISMADVDGDGRTDLLVSAPGGDGPDNSRTDCGEAYLISGKALVSD
jgi:FG-GAP repeat